MIVYLRHDEIDRDRWDECISRSLNRRIYAFSWYLDIVSPGWEALALEDYSAVFPLTKGKKAGVNYLYQPYFAQQLGVFSVLPVDKEVIAEFMKSVPAHLKYIDIQVTPGVIFDGKGIVLKARTNHELYLDKSYEEISAVYSQNTRRNLRKASDLLVKTSDKVSPEELVKLFRENFGEKEGKLQAMHYDRILKLIKVCTEKRESRILGAYDKHNELSAAAFLPADGKRFYFLFAASASIARENGAMFLLIDQFIREHSQTSNILDFEGGNDPGLGRFYKSFGSSEVKYHRIVRNGLPVLLNTGLKLARALRRNVK